LIESYLAFVLHAATAYRYCTIKSHSGKSWCWQYKIQKCLEQGFSTTEEFLRNHGLTLLKFSRFSS